MRGRRILLCVLLWIVCVWLVSPTAPLSAQAVKRLQWEMPTTTLAQAQSYAYFLIVDLTTPIEVVATCQGTQTITCSTSMPALTPGPIHALILYAVEPVHGLAGGQSSPFPVSIPSVPSMIKVI